MNLPAISCGPIHTANVYAGNWSGHHACGGQVSGRLGLIGEPGFRDGPTRGHGHPAILAAWLP